jgi:hypothetical protein
MSNILSGNGKSIFRPATDAGLYNNFLCIECIKESVDLWLPAFFQINSRRYPKATTGYISQIVLIAIPPDYSAWIK